MKSIFVVILALINSTMIVGQYKLNFELEGKTIPKLYLHGTTIDGKNIILEANNSNGTFEFLLEKNRCDSIRSYKLTSKPFDRNERIYYTIGFKYVTYSGDTLVLRTLYLDRNINKLTGSFYNTDIVNNAIIEDKGQIFRNSTISVDEYIVSDKNLYNTELDLAARYPFFSKFYSFFDSNVQYEDYVNGYIDLIKEYPNSYYFLISILDFLHDYKCKEDVQKLFSNFSDSLKQTIYGEKIQEYLFFNEFPNEKLILTGSDKEEYIIQDTTKYNLVIFSASWCAPCHKMIPLLKEIYRDLNKKIIFTYISIDEPSYIDKWRNLMEKEQIPWRSLVIHAEKIQALRDQYFVGAIPLTYLVHPGKHSEIIDVRRKEDKDKLYSLFK